MAMEINTNQYRGAHGCRPQGFGRWGFKMILYIRGTSGGEVPTEYWHTATYSEAKRRAQQHAKAIAQKNPDYRVSSISVLS